MADDNESKKLILFYYDGKTYMGYLWSYGTDEQKAKSPSFNGWGGKLTGKDKLNQDTDDDDDSKDDSDENESEPPDCWIIQAPCQIEFQLVEIPGATSRLEFKTVMPLFPHAVHQGIAGSVYFAFPKATTIMSNISGSLINGSLVNAYQQMTGLN